VRRAVERSGQILGQGAFAYIGWAGKKIGMGYMSPINGALQ
jgi:hypothetical protein